MTSTNAFEAGGELPSSQNRKGVARGQSLSHWEQIKTSTTLKKRLISPDGDSNLDGPSGVSSATRTAGEIAREKKLRADPMADVLGPLYVSCRRCGARIKLSPKSTYDPFHWQKHRERCLKKPATWAKERKGGSQREATTLESEPTSPFSAKLTSATPSLPTEDDEEMIPLNLIKESHTSEIQTKPPSPGIVLKSFEPNPAFDEYLVRSRRRPMCDQPPLSQLSWHSWSWDQLKAPVWVVASYPDLSGGSS